MFAKLPRIVLHGPTPPLTAGDLKRREAMSACTSNACKSGRAGCPTPDACRLPDGAGVCAAVGWSAAAWTAVALIGYALVF